jgi:hypothetical protein
VDVPEVSQYRLAAHLSLAFLIQALLVWTALSVLVPERMAIPDTNSRKTRKLAVAASITSSQLSDSSSRLEIKFPDFPKNSSYSLKPEQPISGQPSLLRRPIAGIPD